MLNLTLKPIWRALTVVSCPSGDNCKENWGDLSQLSNIQMICNKKSRWSATSPLQRCGLVYSPSSSLTALKWQGEPSLTSPIVTLSPYLWKMPTVNCPKMAMWVLSSSSNMPTVYHRKAMQASNIMSYVQQYNYITIIVTVLNAIACIHAQCALHTS